MCFACSLPPHCAAMSAATFAPELPTQSGATLNYIRRAAISQRMEASRPEFEKSGYLRIDPVDGSELWRISLRVAAFEDIDFGQFVDDLRQLNDALEVLVVQVPRLLLGSRCHQVAEC